MPAELVVLVLAALPAVLAIRLLPRPHGANAVAGLSAAVMTLLSWPSAVWLLAGLALTQGAMTIGDRCGRKTPAFLVATAIHVILLLVLRELSDQDYLEWALLGGAYFTLRNIHVLSDWWTGALARPTPADLARYHFFLPVLAAGPIHRFELFRRQLQRRRNDAEDLAAGAERLLWGAFQFTVLGGWMMTRIERQVTVALDGLTAFALDWIVSALGWIGLYFSFAGLSSMAIALSLMMGLRIEENFRQPWRATDLLDFWTRWHMTLTGFSRDYIFRPVSALSRSAVIGAFASMLFLGLWHGSSVYWLGWGLWQGLGILLTLQARRSGLFGRWPVWTGRLFCALWLTATMPVVSHLSGVTP